MDKIVLLILFNHKYEANLEKLRRIYSSRFSNIYFIMPFYKGSDKDVICVYGNSFYFQTYIAQALQQIKKEYKHYIIIGDDLLLNPAINESNYKTEFNLKNNTGFIPEVFTLDNHKTQPRLLMPGFESWVWNKNAVSFNYKNQNGIEVEKELPGEETALKIIKSHGYIFNNKLTWNQLVGSGIKVTSVFEIKNILKNIRHIFFNIKSYITFLSKNKRKLKYPMVGSYSDIVIIPETAIEDFGHYCGVFGSLNLFVEIAIPTALMFSTESITQEKDLLKKGITHWKYEESQVLKNNHNSNLNDLLAHFPQEILYIHPIKLSQWK